MIFYVVKSFPSPHPAVVEYTIKTGKIQAEKGATNSLVDGLTTLNKQEEAPNCTAIQLGASLFVHIEHYLIFCLTTL
jgi:hypothetical protein